MKRYLIFLSYFGTRYRGFQQQNLLPSGEDFNTVCGLLEIALKSCEPVNHPTVTPSSRTDKGVHALCNTVHVDLEDGLKPISAQSIAANTNRFFSYHNHDIRVLKVQFVEDDFHCRHHAYERRYLYRLAVPRPGVPFHQRLVIPTPITEYKRCHFLQHSNFDSEAIKSACSIFVGKKDFNAVATNPKGTERLRKRDTNRTILSLQLEPGAPFVSIPQLSDEYDFWHFTCSGKSFLYHQVRRMLGALVKYGQGNASLADLQRLIDEPVESSWAPINQIVPAHGLFLVNVLYPAEALRLSEDQLKLNKLKDIEANIIQTLKNFEGTISEKIDLKKRLLEVKKKLCIRGKKLCKEDESL